MRVAFRRAVRGERFSDAGLVALFEMLKTSYIHFKLDVGAIDDDFSESDWEAISKDFGLAAESMDEVREYLQKRTWYAETTSGCFIYQSTDVSFGNHANP